MICDRIENLTHYRTVCKGIDEIASFLAVNDVSSLAPGSYDVCDGVFVNVEEYAPGANDLFEAHREYIDLQYLVSGDEEIACIPLSDAVLEKEYDPSIEAAFYKPCADAAVFRLFMKSGTFAVFEPSDPHSPGRKGRAEKVKKLIFKIKIG